MNQQEQTTVPTSPAWKQFFADVPPPFDRPAPALKTRAEEWADYEEQSRLRVAMLMLEAQHGVTFPYQRADVTDDVLRRVGRADDFNYDLSDPTWRLGKLNPGGVEFFEMFLLPGFTRAQLVRPDDVPRAALAAFGEEKIGEEQQGTGAPWVEGRAFIQFREYQRSIESSHDARHVAMFVHPFCRICAQMLEGSAGSATERLLHTWLVTSGRPPRDDWDGVLPWDLIEQAKALDLGDQPRFLSAGDLASLGESRWHNPYIPAGSVGYITGRDHSFKSFLALDAVLDLAVEEASGHLGDLWWGATDEDASYPDGSGRGSIYCVGEGVRGMAARIAGWFIARGHGTERDPEADLGSDPHDALRDLRQETDDPDAFGVTLVNGCPNLFEPDALYEDLLDRARLQQPRLIVIDTLNRASGSADQNSASDMSVIRANVARLREAGGDDCTVIVVAHTDKGDRDARGSSAIEDDADFVLHVKKTGDRDVRVTVAKQRDGESGGSFELVAQSHGSSLALARSNVSSATSVANDVSHRVTSVLWNARHLDPLTVPQIMAALNDDATGQTASKTTVYDVLSTLVSSGKVVKQKQGSTAARYLLDRAAFTDDHWTTS